jgi:hypothetical protein
MSHTQNHRTPLACVLICSLFVTVLITLTTRQSHASNNSLPHSSSFRISGRVARSDGVGIEFVPMSLGGTESGSTQTDGDGYYSFDNLPAGGNYTVYAPSCCMYTFEPSEQSFYDLQANETADFRTAGVTVSGWVGTADGEGLAGITINLNSGWEVDLNATTDSSGYYEFTDVPTATHLLYSLQPTTTGYRFNPPGYGLGSLTEDQTELDFVAASRTCRIIGVVRHGAARVAGVTVKLTSPSPDGFAPRTATTSNGGAYSFPRLPPGRTYTVTAMKLGYQFTPARVTIADLNAVNTAVNFDVKVYSISGRITRRDTGAGIGAVTVALRSPTSAGFPARTVQTDSTGNYTFTYLPAGRDYTIKPTRSGFTFGPATRSITNLKTNIPVGAATSFTGTGP